MKKVLFFLIATFSALNIVFGQKTLNNQVFINIDNDRFTADATDKYYTSGIEVGWQKVITDSTFLKKLFIKKTLIKSSFRFDIAHKIYTPKNIASLIEQMHDRPYASTITVSGDVNMFLTAQSLIKIKLEVGATGKISGGEAFQKWWHKQSKITLPIGWEKQIANSPIININLFYSKQWFDANWLDFITESNLQFGTLRTSTKHGGVMRVGIMDKFHQSSYSNNRIGSMDFRRRFEIYVYYGLSMEFVKYNGLIQGNWIGKKSPHTLEITPRVYYSTYGIIIGNRYIDFNFSYQNLTKEMEHGLKHKYASIQLNIRF